MKQKTYKCEHCGKEFVVNSFEGYMHSGECLKTYRVLTLHVCGGHANLVSSLEPKCVRARWKVLDNREQPVSLVLSYDEEGFPNLDDTTFEICSEDTSAKREYKLRRRLIRHWLWKLKEEANNINKEVQELEELLNE